MVNGKTTKITPKKKTAGPEEYKLTMAKPPTSQKIQSWPTSFNNIVFRIFSCVYLLL